MIDCEPAHDGFLGLRMMNCRAAHEEVTTFDNTRQTNPSLITVPSPAQTFRLIGLVYNKLFIMKILLI